MRQKSIAIWTFKYDTHTQTHNPKLCVPRLLAISGALVLGQEAKFELKVLLDRDAVVLGAPGGSR